MAKTASGLTEKQHIFVKEYLVDRVATRAAIAAGYAKGSAEVAGSRLLRNAKVRAEVNKGTEKLVKKLDLSAEYVLDGVKDTVERCRQAVPVLDRKGRPVMVETSDGEIAPAYTFNALGALKGFELLGKHLKLFTEKHEHSGAGGTPLPPPVIKVVFRDHK